MMSFAYPILIVFESDDPPHPRFNTFALGPIFKFNADPLPVVGASTVLIVLLSVDEFPHPKFKTFALDPILKFNADPDPVVGASIVLIINGPVIVSPVLLTL